MKLVLLSQDLMIGSRVERAAQQCGLAVETVGTTAAAVEAVSQPESRLLLIDLRLPGLDVQELANSVSETEVPIVACAPHVHEARLTAAREAGCDAVITRGQLDRELESVLASLLNGV